jgi:class 3 adenylate cyclase
VPSGAATVLCADVAGAARAWEESPAAMTHAMRRHDELLATIAARHGGSAVQAERDGSFAVFARARDAVAAATAILDRFAREPWPTPGPLRARIALSTGEVVRRDAIVTGPALDRGARLRDISHGGQIILGASTAAALAGSIPDDHTLHDRGSHRLADLAEAEHVFELSHHGAPAFPPLRSLEAVRHNLPVLAAVPPADTGRVETALREARLVTVIEHDPARASAAALTAAATVAHRYRGVFRIDVAGASPAGDGDAAIDARALAALGQTSPEGANPRDALIASLRGERILLVLDGCDAVAEDAAFFVEALLRACPDLQIIATASVPLMVPGEALAPLDPRAPYS